MKYIILIVLSLSALEVRADGELDQSILEGVAALVEGANKFNERMTGLSSNLNDLKTEEVQEHWDSAVTEVVSNITSASIRGFIKGKGVNSFVCISSVVDKAKNAFQAAYDKWNKSIVAASTKASGNSPVMCQGMQLLMQSADEIKTQIATEWETTCKSDAKCIAKNIATLKKSMADQLKSMTSLGDALVKADAKYSGDRESSIKSVKASIDSAKKSALSSMFKC